MAGSSQDTRPTPLPTPTPDEPLPTQPNFNKPLPPIPDLVRVGVDAENQLPITLQDAVEMALKNSNDIEASRKSVHIAEFALQADRGVYDPVFNSQTYFESRTTPTASTIGGAVNGKVTQKSLYNDLGLSGYSPWQGGQYSGIFNQSRTTTSNRNTTLNPQFPTDLILNYTQPLFRNRTIDANRRNILISARGVDLTESQLRQEAITIIAQVESSYWDLYNALRNQQVQMDTLKQARDQYESTRRQAEKGAVAPIDVVQAEAQVYTFEQNVHAAVELVTRAENTLKPLIFPNRNDPDWNRPLIPTTPADIQVPHMAMEIASAEALKNRPELEQVGINEEINRIDQRFYRNQAKPQIDLFGTYTGAGLAGTPNPLSSGFLNVPDILKGGYGTSLGNLFGQEFPTYRAGVTISFPLRNRTAKANLGGSIVRGAQLENQRLQLEQNIESEVRNALQAMISAEFALTAAVAARDAAEQLYESESRQYRAGLTTLFIVTQRQTDLSAARGREILARTLLNRAISTFNRSIGRTLAVNNVEVSK
ncbi:MAG TPA: TolC family protein [Pyrinomonadaceae bacterium]|nr:TolC family protein [Pyrinomonadaceae bacterium]